VSSAVCPDCRGPLDRHQTEVHCRSCSARYPLLAGGYLNLTPSSSTIGLIEWSPDDVYLAEQDCGTARAQRWLARYVRPTDRRALDIGCGTASIGKRIGELYPAIDVWGVDLPGNLVGWQDTAADPERVLAGSALDLPFESGMFDLVWSFGVIEHIGEPDPPADRESDRLRYISEMMRVLTPGGRAIIVAPNKSFPLDPAHDWSTNDFGHRLFERTHLCLHATWGPHPLMSFGEVKRLARLAGASKIRPLNMANYFDFARVGAGRVGWVVPAARFYLNRLPDWLGATPLAPFLAVELTRE
jgi:SAM-dependent methyltransferase